MKDFNEVMEEMDKIESTCNHIWIKFDVVIEQPFLYFFKKKKKWDYHRCAVCRNVLIEHGTPNNVLWKILDVGE